MPAVQSKPLSQSELNQKMRNRADALSKLFKELGIPLECLYTSWEDAMRAYGSAQGPNITDVGLVFRNQAGDTRSAETFGFKIRSGNFNEILIEIDARCFKIVVPDANGQNPRMVTLAYALENAGKLFKHAGLPEDCNLYCPEYDNGNIKLRLDMIFAPQGEKATGAEWAAKEFSLTGYNYQAREKNARNIGLFSHPQGTSCADDGNGKLYLRPQVWDDAKKELAAFWTEAEDTGKTVQDMHTETAEESAAAAARGKGTAVRAGCDGWDKLPNLFSYIQIPRVQTRNAPVRSSIASAVLAVAPAPALASAVSAASAASAWQNGPPTKSFKASPLSTKGVHYRSLGASAQDPVYDEEDGEEDEDETPCMRSLGSSAPLPPPSLTSARLSRGSYAGIHPGVKSDSVERAKEPITITCTLVFMLASDDAPDTATVTAAWSSLQRMAKIAGTPKELMDKDAKLTTGEPLTKEDEQDISDKQAVHPAPPQMPTAPIVGMVVD